MVRVHLDPPPSNAVRSTRALRKKAALAAFAAASPGSEGSPVPSPKMNGSSRTRTASLIVRSDVPSSDGFDIVDREKHRFRVALPREGRASRFEWQT